MLAVFKREFKSYFTNPLGFILLAVIYFFSGNIFKDMYEAGAPYVEIVVLNLSTYFLFFIPVITMRLFSDERRQKTDQVLFTSPVKLISVVLGKYFAAMALYALSFVPTIIFEIIVAAYVKVNVFYYIYALIGILLFGAALVAIGMFVSALTESPVTSIVFTLIVTLFIMAAPGFASDVEAKIAVEPAGFIAKIWAWILERVVDFLNMMDFSSKLNSFAEQSFAFNDIVFFLSITVAFIFLTERVLEKRRWA